MKGLIAMEGAAGQGRASRRLSVRQRWATYGALGLVVLSIGAAMFANRHVAAAQPVQPSPALTVTSATPRHVVWASALQASGVIAAWQEAIVGARIGGYQLIDVRVNVGDQVKRGQLLAQLDPALLRADAVQLQANYDQAEANRGRAVTLKSSGAMSDQDVLQFVTQAKTAAAQLASRQLQLRYTDVTAPDDGVISSRTATLGAVASVGQELFRLIRRNRLEWRGELTAAQLAAVAAGQRVTLTLPDGSAASGRVRQTAPSLDTESRLGTVYADLDPGSRARAGMFATGHVVLTQSAALVIPSQSVVIRDGRNFVFRLADASVTPKVSLQAVTVGRREGNEVEILDGLRDDVRVVVQGAGFLNDGDFVRLADKSSTASSPPSKVKG
jgi:RND family efflux transporter MFP subunit